MLDIEQNVLKMTRSYPVFVVTDPAEADAGHSAKEGGTFCPIYYRQHEAVRSTFLILFPNADCPWESAR